ncbi:AMP-binding protein [Ferroplasma acidarmanus]|uniref:AMP-binding enzyme n=1 Tax=Ferroplasma acidarmanus Fer1 TaxID=333146 RepID=S0AQ05_FERAC|nr:AMP-binding protein [Ferroplasma acidarmanus]AGO61016.1 AMP-binding enzyme [Ferroplasma acidarmanus Fer1]
MIEAINTHVNIPDISMYSLLLRNAEVNGSRPIIIFYDKYITYSKLLKYVDSMAYQLEHRLNVRKGETIAIIMDFSPPYIISIISSIKIGARILIIDGKTDDNTINGYIDKYSIKVMIICKKFAEKAKNEQIKYIVSDPNDFLTLGKALINNIYNRSYVKYGNNVLKFYEFIYSDNVPALPEAHEPSCIMFHIKNELLAFNMKSIIGETFIINYWLPKFDGKPVFYSDIDHSTPLGLIYSIALPISFSGTIVINSPASISRNACDFVVGTPSFYSHIIEKKINISGVKYCIMPFYDREIENAFHQYTNIPLIAGRSDQFTLTTHMNPFDDIRVGSFGMPVNYVECMINPENELLIKTPYLPAIYENNKKKEYEWYNSYTKVKVVDNYYYSL